ncbi:PPOX class F420-dependent oxidoreductase [Streptomyces benahoarensis]|uniref:PPOX class F420-dependent oxidoreductase n=1 Tax=Streptomyces benahoarensis TaxID=2595054 RepID=A0A553ZRX0_9ACTN|nr:PPOX class F420-dependent oxidoreductase [Streptomyces benahoarensis]TSB31150.1 PPOX class F420-dependent oxidoreductase [Streptomyces benahoarensis]TSB44095.1 PPOX class F420-dependent oxidoreductase [Streptomyces benahoarensis]
MARKMAKEEWLKFLSEGTRTGKLSTVRGDGLPHVAPVWFVMDGDELVFNTGKETVKGRNLLRDGKVALCVDDERPPFAFVVLQGTAEIGEDVADVRHWATRIAARYMGEERAEEFGARNGVPGELVVRVRVNKVIAMADLAA